MIHAGHDNTIVLVVSDEKSFTFGSCKWNVDFWYFKLPTNVLQRISTFFSKQHA